MIVKNKKIAQFAKWVLDIGEGKYPAYDDNNDTDEKWIQIPSQLLLQPMANNIEAITDVIYHDFSTNFTCINYLAERAVICPLNTTVDVINDTMLEKVPGDSKIYLSYDSIVNSIEQPDDFPILYPPEFLNSITLNNFSQHRLALKINVPVVLLCNIDQSIGLCNGTRLLIVKLGDYVIEGKIITGSHIGEHVCIPRVVLHGTSPKWPFTLARRQFPIKVCYALTINKCQGQTLQKVGIYLKGHVFSHGQLYVAVSRVTSQEGLKILIENEDGTSGTATKNIVYRMTCIPLKDINQGSYKTKICARLTRLSEFILDDKPEQIQRLDFVLLDVEGHAIEAQVPQQHISRFLSRLKEGTVYFVEFFQVVPCRTNYRAVSHTYMIKFTCHTRVTEFNAAPPTLPKYAYTLASFDTLRTRIDYTADMSDTIGRIVSVEPATTAYVKGLKKAIRHLYISDGRESIEVVLWSRQATEFPAEKIIELSKEKPIILLLLGIIAKSREGQLKIQGSMSCQYHINPAIPEAAALINKFTGFPHQVTWTGAATSSSSDIMTTSVTELAKLTNPHELYGNIYQVNVVLRTISPNQPWWYLGCILCRKRVFPEGETYRCPKCSGNKAEPI
ncbi:uncharacterized protein LOC120665331 isoform X7 [Panicum virgatum]|uniref:uncharacterized protein LOC120665331 isoform X7 n=1 Tax=Panicum virgatum TaxID=38727 RepID=UPI0019D57BC4|nr:uncharacterized protein LOC120665331 isoform X7 [Panicum virgatum]